MNRSRVLLVSVRDLLKDAWLCSQFESEEVIAEIDQVDLARPQLRRRGTSPAARLCTRALRRLGGIDLSFLPQAEPIRLTRQYDLFFFKAVNVNGLHALSAVPGWREKCRHAICWIDEVWVKDLAKAKRFEPLKQFDQIIITKRNTAGLLGALTGRPCHWMPSAVDTLQFCPWPDPPGRKVDFFLMGRIAPSVHRAVWEHSLRRGWTYLFDTIPVRHVHDAAEHRRQFRELIKRSRFFLVQKAKAGVPEETGSQEELAYRYYEGAAGGAVLVGDRPRDASSEICFGWPDAVIRLPERSDEIGGFLDGLCAQPERLERISRENVRHALLQHDWAHRWREVLRIADLPPTEKLELRLNRLATQAALLEDHRSVPGPAAAITPLRAPVKSLRSPG